MKGSKLIELIETLDKEEIRLFGSYLEGESYRKSSAVFKLYHYLKGLHPTYPEKKIAKEVVFKKIMPKGKEFNNKSMRDTMSNLSLSLERFLLKLEIERNEVEREFLLLNILQKRQKDKLFFQKIKQLQKKWTTNRPSGIEQYHNEYKLLHYFYHHPNFSTYSETNVHAIDLMEKIDHYYFASKLYYIVNDQHFKRMLTPSKEERPVVLADEILNNHQLPFFKDNLHVSIFGKILDSFDKDDYSYFSTLKELYFTNIDVFSKVEQRDLFLYLQRFCNEHYWQGKTEYLRKMFELNKVAVELRLMIENGFLSNDVFRNFVQTACVSKEFDWTAKFIDEHESFLEEANRTDIVSLCRAALAFYAGQFETTLEHLAMVKFQDVLYGMHVRYLQLQTYYELDNYEEAFDNLTNSFSAFLSRNTTIGPKVKEAGLNFIKYVKKLHSHKLSFEKISNNVIIEIQASNNIANKTWLTEKAKALAH